MKNFLPLSKDFRFNEVLFENRNKNYGAYVLRNEEGNILLKATLVGIAFFGAISITPLIINSFETPKVIVENNGPYVLQPMDPIPEKLPEIVKPIPQTIIKINTISLQVPTPTKDSKKQKPPALISDIANNAIGTDDIVGQPTTVPTIAIHTIPIVAVPDVQPIVKVDNNPATIVDVEADFSGGINAFRNKVIQNFDTDNFNGTGDLMKTTISFIVEKDGTISGIKANGKDANFNKEAEQTIKTIKGKWIPAKLKGQNVRSYFNFPISMQFE